MSLEVMMKRRNAAVDKMGAILALAKAEDRDLSADERKEYDAATKEANELNADIERVKAHEKMQATLDKVEPAAASRSAVRDQFAGGVPDAKTKFEGFGEFLNAALYNPNDSRLEYQEGMRGEHRTDSGGAGGFAIPREYLSGVREVSSQEAIIRPMATVLPAGMYPDAEVSFPTLDQGENSNMFGGVTVNWEGEGAEVGKSGIKLNEVTLKANELVGSAVLTNKLLRNWQVAGAYLEMKFRDALAATEDRAFLSADGVAKPTGILKSDGTLFVPRVTANTVTYADIVEMYSKLHASGKASWLVSRSLITQLMKIKDDEGHLIWATSAREGEPNTLLGLPVRFSQRSPNKGSAGDLLLGSFNEYLIKDGMAPLVSASEHVRFDTNKTVIKIVSSVDGAPSLNKPLKGEDGNTYSPFVALDVPLAG